MVVKDFNLLWSSSGPAEADPPLVVDANTMLTPAIAFEHLKPVPWWNAKLVQALRVTKLAHLPQRHRVDPGIDRAHPISVPETLCVFVGERLDHDSTLSPITRSVNNAQR